jgi:hypothetical protein
MPVRRFRSIEEMNQPRWRKPGDPELYAAIAAFWRFGARTGRRRVPPGVHKHRSIEALNAATERWAQADFDARRQ